LRDLDTFAQSDGFEHWAEMRAFWQEHHPNITTFLGVVI